MSQGSETGQGNRIVGGQSARVVFHSDAFNAADERKRFALLRDQWHALYGAIDLTPPDDGRFHANFEFIPTGSVGIGRFTGTVSRIARSAREVARDGADNFCFGLRCGQSNTVVRQNGHEARLAEQAAVLLSNSETGEVCANGDMGWYAVNTSRKALLETVPGAEDLIGVPLNAQNEALRHLQRYLDILFEPGGIGDDPALTERIDNVLFDLIALSLGVASDQAQIAQMRGLRAARLQALLAVMRANYADPAFSSHEAARALGLSRRYVNDLLYRTGVSFAERLLELRLQRARSMLTDPRHQGRKISEIAYACGFNEVSNFNRHFRARFGASPTGLRGGNGSGVL